MRFLLSILAVFSLTALAQAAALPTSDLPKYELPELSRVMVQENQTLKTFDSFARQALWTITSNKVPFEKPAVVVVLDMMFRPQRYENANIIYIKNKPFRKEFDAIPGISAEEKHRILDEGTVSFEFWRQPQVQATMAAMQDNIRAKAVGEIETSANTLGGLIGVSFTSMHAFAPLKASDEQWKSLADLAGNLPGRNEGALAQGAHSVAPVEGYDPKVVVHVAALVGGLNNAWTAKNIGKVNDYSTQLAQLLPTINPAVYPSSLRRSVEIVYNRFAGLTIPGAMLYALAFVMFLVSSRAGLIWVRLWALRLFIIAFLVHTAAIAVRWWLIQKNVGNWFEAIPIKNQFESVLFSAWFGCLVGLILELWRSRSFFGAAASFVGWLSLVALFSAPYVFGRDIGGIIGQANGVLMSYWLYIHVTMVTTSYALIGMSFCLSVWWLVKYNADRDQISDSTGYQLSADVARFDALPDAGGAMTVGLASTLARVLFFRPAAAEVKVVARASAAAANPSASFLATLDLCNLVILQLIFWILGLGIIFGAIWADMSWGRPWGWDPKETFALVTWIMYLINVHVRVATENKGLWSSTLSIVGFGFMLFNWIGVNFFLVGLHSYA